MRYRPSLRERLHRTALAVARRLEIRHIPDPRWVTVEDGPLAGRELWLDPDAAPWQEAMARGRFEHWIYEALAQVTLGERPVVWDVGAHVGYHTLALAVLVGPGGRVVSVEPVPLNGARLDRNLRRHPDLAARVELHPYVIGERDGEAVLSLGLAVDDGSSSGSAVPECLTIELRDEHARNPTALLKMRSVDSLVSGGVPPPVFLKIDVEGAEAAVLRGARQVLSTLRPHVCVEVHNVRAVHDVEDILRTLDYRTAVLQAQQRCVGHIWALPAPEVPA